MYYATLPLGSASFTIRRDGLQLLAQAVVKLRSKDANINHLNTHDCQLEDIWVRRGPTFHVRFQLSESLHELRQRDVSPFTLSLEDAVMEAEVRRQELDGPDSNET